MSQAVADILVKITKVVSSPRARNAFVLAKNVRGVFRAGESPLDSEAPFIDEQEAVELMKEIMAGVEKNEAKHKAAFRYYRLESHMSEEAYREIIDFVQQYLKNQENEELAKHASQNNTLLSQYLYNTSNFSIFRNYYFMYENLPSSDFNWEFEVCCEIFAASTALVQVVIEILRRVLPKAPKCFGKEIDVDEAIQKAFTDLDKSIDEFFDYMSHKWIPRTGEIQRFMSVPVGNAAVSHDGNLYLVSLDGTKIQKFEDGGCQDVCTDLNDVKQLASHKGWLYCIADKGKLYEVEVNTSKLVLDDVVFANCVSMVSLGDYLYLTLDKYFHNFYQVNPTDKTFTCLKSWSGARLATLDTRSSLYVRSRLYLWDVIMRIKDPTQEKSPYYKVGDEWSASNSQNLVGLGEYLYTQGGDGDLFVLDPSDPKAEKIYGSNANGEESMLRRRFKRRGATDQLVPLASHKLSVVCQHLDDSEDNDGNPHLSIVRPFFNYPPRGWFERVVKSGGLK